MAGSFEVHSDGTVTVRFEYTATVEKINNSVGDAVHYLYPATFGEILDGDGALIPFEELTAQQKLDVLDAWLRKSVVDLAWQYDRRRIREKATVEAALTAGDRYF